MPMCYNVGKLDVSLNGWLAQISAKLDSHDPTWDRGKLIYHDEKGEVDVGMFYSFLSPRQSRELAQKLFTYAEKLDKIYEITPYWVVLVNYGIAHDIDSHEPLVYANEDEVKKAVEECKEKCPEDHWGYRKLTVDEFYEYVGY